MKNSFRSGLLLGFILQATGVFSQKIFSEGMLVYKVSIQQAGTTVNNLNNLREATNTVYIKGYNCRTDMSSSLGKEITIFNSKSDNAVILKEFSGQKLMITLSKENWKAKNKQGASLKFQVTDELRIIEGYNTRKAFANTPDGKSLMVFYAPDLLAGNREYDATFSNLPGLPIEYEIESGKMKFKYTLSKISYEPVLASQFDFPTSGYRIMSYEENQQLKKGNNR
jgi:GLPGLI family protein